MTTILLWIGIAALWIVTTWLISGEAVPKSPTPDTDIEGPQTLDSDPWDTSRI